MKRQIGSPRSSNPPLRESLIKKVPPVRGCYVLLKDEKIWFTPLTTEETATLGAFVSRKPLYPCFLWKKGSVNFRFGKWHLTRLFLESRACVWVLNVGFLILCHSWCVKKSLGRIWIPVGYCESYSWRHIEPLQTMVRNKYNSYKLLMDL